MTQQQGTKHERTCIACGKKDVKTNLFRIVRTRDGGAAFDATGRMQGRGAYVCSGACFETLASGRLQRALKTNVSEENLQEIRSALQALAVE